MLSCLFQDGFSSCFSSYLSTSTCSLSVFVCLFVPLPFPLFLLSLWPQNNRNIQSLFMDLDCFTPRSVIGKLISQQSQISTGQQLKFLLRATFFKLKLLLTPLLQNRLAQALGFCGRATFKGPKSCMWLLSPHLPTTALRNLKVSLL
uniref:Uncharacterized protein n=1 Tax=Pipistrellus kuhlii TaxID=59472 RepID=A0A7J7XV76_PIPKU|nr:hypothetical protein mPipKuh1_010504 [Pipistrellus kuhlii]